jgi:hypothetical protein
MPSAEVGAVDRAGLAADGPVVLDELAQLEHSGQRPVRASRESGGEAAGAEQRQQR